MTCIAGVKQGGSVWIGADTEATWGATKHQSETKIISKGGVVMAGTGASAVFRALEHRLSVPRIPEKHHKRWMAVDLMDSMRSVFQTLDLWQKDEGIVNGFGAVIIGFRDILASIDAHLALYPEIDGYVAHGSGGQAALGSLHTTNQYDIDPDVRIRLAVQASQKWSVGVGGNVHVKRVPNGSA